MLLALIETGQTNDHELKVLNAVQTANDLQKHILTNKIKKYFSENLSRKHIALWGLAFKPNTDDMRETPCRVPMTDLLEAGAAIKAYDPAAMQEAQRIFDNTSGLRFARTPYEALDQADALTIVTEWKEFRSPDFSEIARKLKHKVIFDGRNMYDPENIKLNKIIYQAMGHLTS